MSEPTSHTIPATPEGGAVTMGPDIAERARSWAEAGRDAAYSGYERAYRAVDDADLGGVLDTLRRFGRRHPLALAGISALAGIAVGRLLRGGGRDEPHFYPQPGEPDRHHAFQHADLDDAPPARRPRRPAPPLREANVFHGGGRAVPVRAGAVKAGGRDGAASTRPTSGMEGTAAPLRGPTAGQGEPGAANGTGPTAGMEGTARPIGSPSGGHHE